MIADAIRWLVIKPEPEYVYPDHYDADAYWHALSVLCRPTPWRWYVRAALAAYRAHKEDT